MNAEDVIAMSRGMDALDDAYGEQPAALLFVAFMGVAYLNPEWAAWWGKHITGTSTEWASPVTNELLRLMPIPGASVQ